MELPLRLISSVSAIDAAEASPGLASIGGGSEGAHLVIVAILASLAGAAVASWWMRKIEEQRLSARRRLAEDDAIAQLHGILDGWPLPGWLLDEKGHFTYANLAAQKLLRIDEKRYGSGPEACGQPAEVCVRWSELNRRALLHGPLWEDFALSQEGATVHGVQLVAPLRSHGKVVHLIGFLLDRSDRLRAEQARDQAELRLAQHLRQLPFAAMEWDLDGSVKAWNPGAQSVFGYTQSEAIGKSAVSLIVPDDQRAAYTDAWRTLVEQRTPVRLVLRSRTKSERNIVCEWSSSPLLDEARRVIGVISFAREILDPLELAAPVQQSLHLESMGRLAAGVAHEFNNLLAPMVIEVERIAHHADEPSRVVGHVTALRLAIAQARELTERAQLIAAHAPDGRDWMDLSELVDSSIDQLRGGLDRRIQISLSLDRTLPRLSASRTAVVQILTNLILNARDAFPPQLVHPGDASWRAAITISTARYDGVNPGVPAQGASTYQVITVRDNGPGLSAAAREHVFEPFFTTKSPGSGHGLGLALVWRLAKDHQGWVTLKSEEGKGCELRVFLPERSVPRTPASSPDAPVVAAGAVDRRPGLLLVEDNLLVANALAGVLEDRGYRVFSAETGERAWELLSEESASIDLALCDLNLPGISGRELLEKIKHTEHSIPFVMMSGYVAQSDSNELNRLGAAGLIAKPIDPHELLRIVTRIAPLPT